MIDNQNIKFYSVLITLSNCMTNLDSIPSFFNPHNENLKQFSFQRKIGQMIPHHPTTRWEVKDTSQLPNICMYRMKTPLHTILEVDSPN